MACSSEFEPTIEEGVGQTDKTTSLSRSMDEVMLIAEAGRNLINEQSRSQTPKVMVGSVTAIRASKGRSDIIDTVMYAVNYEDEKGFILISAVNTVTPIIGISDCGSFNSADEIGNENFQFYLNAAKEYIVTETEQKLNGSTSQESMMQASEGAFEIIKEKKMYPARLKTQWNHKSWPENFYCPNKIAGCGPLALAQILAYEGEPASMELTFPGRDKNIQVFNWADIVRHGHTEGDTCIVCANSRADILNPCRANKESHYEIGRLVRQLGELTDARYKESGTSTYFFDICNVAKDLLPDYEISYYNSGKLFDKIKENYMVGIVTGQDDETFDHRVGHAWIMDGAMTIYVITKRKDDPSDAGKILSQTNYIHFNWGWGGTCNGYFLDGVFNTEKEYEDPPIIIPNKVKSRYDFKYDVEYITIY